MMPEYQLPLELEDNSLFLILKRIRSTIAPESKRMIVKLDASIAFSPSAKRHNTEFAANATNARPVKRTILVRFFAVELTKLDFIYRKLIKYYRDLVAFFF